MSASWNEFTEAAEKIAPPFLKEEWDHCGLQLRVSPGPVRKILVALEVTEAVAAEAAEIGADLILAHHPLIFRSIDRIDCREPLGRLLLFLVENGISVYTAHTTFDKAMGGNNDHLLKLLALPAVVITGTGAFGEDGIGRICRLQTPMPLAELVRRTGAALGLSGKEMRIAGEMTAPVERLAVCTGAGGSLVEEAAANGCQLLITGDVRYHEAQTARQLGLCVIDAGHYDTEKIFIPNFTEKLRCLLGEKADVEPSKVNINPFWI